MNFQKIAGEIQKIINKTERLVESVLEQLECWDKRLSIHLSRIYPAAKCGHTSKQADIIRLNGKNYLVSLFVTREKVALCHECLKKTAIICAWCRQPIFIGSSVTLFSPKSSKFSFPKGSFIYKEKPLLLVGCTRNTCFNPEQDNISGFYVLGKNNQPEIRKKRMSLPVIKNSSSY